MLPDAAVPAEVAYAAALDRCQRTTEALILAEARIRTLFERCARMEEENASLRAELDDFRVKEEVTHDAASESSASERATAHGEARTAQDFSD